MVLPIVLALAATAGPARSHVVLARVMDLPTACHESHVPAYSELTVEPDAQVGAALRYPSRKKRGCDNPGGNVLEDSDFVLLDLRSGREMVAGPQTPSPFPPYNLTISRDAATVTVVRQFGDCMRCPYGLSVWNPHSSPDVLLDEDTHLEPASTAGNDAVRHFEWDPDFPSALSPSGLLVAAFGWVYTSRAEAPHNAREIESIAILDIQHHQVRTQPLPVNLEGEASRRFFLTWSNDGASLYAVLHRAYTEWEGPVGPGLVQRAGRPDWVLYRFSLASGKASRIGMVPPTTIGFGPDEHLIVADTIRNGWGPHRAYALVPIERIRDVQLPDNNAGLTFADGLAMTEVVPENDPTFESFRHIWAGRNHTYAEVVKRGTKGKCTVLVELTQPISKDK